MSSIPGLTLCSTEETAKAIEIPSFEGVFRIPDSRTIGSCRNRDEFEKVETISSGDFDEVYKCRDKRSGEFYALKRFHVPFDFVEGMPAAGLREINILNSLKHANVISFFGVASSVNFFSDYLILEYTPFSLQYLMDRKLQDLHKYSVVKIIMKQLFDGLSQIHKMDIIHRAINGHNIHFTETGILKIGGFNNSCYYEKDLEFKEIKNELRYRAPELHFGLKKYTNAIDMWAAGCLLAELVLQKPLFEGNSELEVVSSLYATLGAPSEDIWPGCESMINKHNKKHKLRIVDAKQTDRLHELFSMKCSEDVYEVIRHLIMYFPSIRHTCTECLKCPYFKSLTPETTSKMADELSHLLQKAIQTLYDVPMSH